MDHIFLSDVHFGAFSSDKNLQIESDLIALIEYSIRHKIQIHILGDLFDYWMEYPSHVPSLGAKLLDAFKTYNDEVNQATYILGNHDNWTRGYFESLGFNVIEESYDLTIDSQSVFLHHGDGLSDRNSRLPRPFFHRILRNRSFITLYQFVFPPKTGLKIMKWFSDYSRRGFRFTPEKLNSWSESFLKRSNYDYVFCGHDHIPRVETYSDGVYINTGAFFSQRTLAFYTNKKIELVIWNGEQKKFLPFSQ